MGLSGALTDNLFSITASITPGTPYSYDAYLGYTTDGSFVSSEYENVTLDYSHTAQLVSTVFTDDAGNPVSGETVTSASGFDYLQGPQQAPEPGTAALGVLSLLGGFVLYRRNRRIAGVMAIRPASDL
jgi:hypothetical protein